jgi:hypothetical protein
VYINFRDTRKNFWLLQFSNSNDRNKFSEIINNIRQSVNSQTKDQSVSPKRGTSSSTSPTSHKKSKSSIVAPNIPIFCNDVDEGKGTWNALNGDYVNIDLTIHKYQRKSDAVNIVSTKDVSPLSVYLIRLLITYLLYFYFYFIIFFFSFFLCKA